MKPANWVCAVDPRHADHHVGEGHWMGSYRVRLIDKLDPQTQEVVSFEHIWGVPRHTLQDPFYDELRQQPSTGQNCQEVLQDSINTFRQTLAGKKTMKNFFVHQEPDVTALYAAVTVGPKSARRIRSQGRKAD